LANLHCNYEVKNENTYLLDKFQKGLHVFINEKTQASLSSKCMSNKKNKFVYHVYHEKHKKSLHMACKNQTKDKRKQIAPMSNKMNTDKKCIP